jgi:hypothetical protein
MALVILGETQSESAGWSVEYVASLGGTRVWQDPHGFGVDQGECVWPYPFREGALGLEKDRTGC